MSRKVFNAGEILTASDVNNFLMDQSVMSFASAAARTTAIPSPVEGMLTWLEDVNRYEFYNGSAWEVLISPSTGNAIINGAFEINQRNFTSVSPAGQTSIFGFDRWRTTGNDGTVTYSSQAFSPGAAPVVGYESSNHARILTSGQTVSTASAILVQPIEDVRSFANQTITISFWAKAASGTPKIAIELDQQFGSGGSTRVTTLAGQVTLSTSWARYSVSVLVPSISGKTLGASSTLVLNLWVSAGSNLDARTGSLGIQSNTFDIWGVQLEAGPVATPFRRNANSLQGELAACQRYYFRASSGSTLAVLAPVAYAQNTTIVIGQVQFPVTMRVAPTSAESGNVRFQNFAGTAFTLGALSLDQPTDSMTGVFASTTGLTAGQVGRLLRDNNSAGFIGFSAEL
jgi:hypothetical protein